MTTTPTTSTATPTTSTTTSTTTTTAAAFAEIRKSSNALDNRNITGPHITTAQIDADTLHVLANGVLIAVMVRTAQAGQRSLWASRWNHAGPQLARDPQDLVLDIEDLAHTTSQHEFVREFPAYPPVHCLLADPARDLLTQDSPFRLVWNGHDLGHAVLVEHPERGKQWQIIGRDGAPLSDVEFYTLGEVIDRVNALVPFLVS